MTTTRSGVLLVALYIAAVWLRVHGDDPARYPYFNNESATRFRVAASVAEDGRLPGLDRRAYWPDGYLPVTVGPIGVEWITGQSYRIVSKFSDMSAVRFAGVFIALVFSLCVFAAYATARALWSCTAAGVFAAFMAAFFLPLVEASDGGEFLHAPFAATIAAFGMAALVRWLRGPSPKAAVVAAIAALALHVTWQHAGLYVVLVSAIVLLSRQESSRVSVILGAHFLAVLLAGMVLPHLRSQHYLFSWPAIFVFASAAWAVAGRRLPGRVAPVAYVIGATILLAAIARPLAGGVSPPSLADYWISRLRFIFGKPADPLALSAALRAMWTHHSLPAGWYGIVSFFLPLVLLTPATVLGLRRYREETGRRTGPAVTAALVGAAVFLVDHSAVFAAALCVIPFVGVAFYAFRSQWRARVAPALLAAVVVFTTSVAPTSGMNPSYRLTRVMGASKQSQEGFLWLSLGNADRELARHLVSRSSVRDLFLAPPRIASLMVQFAGRKVVVVPGIGTEQAAERTVDYMRLFYEDESRLYDRCRAMGITRVVYSIDLLLDPSTYSNRYLAGISYMPEGSVAWDMHFKPQRLRHFTLDYENDNYRVFRVTEEYEPFFLTDHPPVYQQSILERHGDSLESFYSRIVDILLTYTLGLELQAGDDDAAAIPRFLFCAEQAPEFTRAWVGIGDSALRMNRLEEARQAYARALQRAPDHAHALYYGAVTVSRLGDREGALGMLEVLLNSTDDRELYRQGLELQAYLKSLDPPAGSGNDS